MHLRGTANRFGNRFGAIAAMVLFGVAISLSVWGDSTTLTISSGSVTVTSSSSTTLDFPISRGPDTSYDAFLQYETQDGTAIAGTDYTAAFGSIVIPAGMTSATIPVTIACNTMAQQSVAEDDHNINLATILAFDPLDCAGPPTRSPQ